MHYYLKSFFIIKSSSGPCHEDPVHWCAKKMAPVQKKDTR